MPLESNIWKILVNRVVRNFLIIMPIFVLFMQSRGLNLFQIFLLQSVFAIVFVLLEVPSGYVSDRLGRKKTLVVASVFGSLGAGVYAFGDSFWWFAAAEALIGVAASFSSGTDSALLFESLEELKRKSEFKRWEGSSESFNRVSEAVAAVLGGVLGAISLQWPFLAWFAVSLLSIPVSLSLTEPSREHLKHAKNPWKEMAQFVRFALHQNKTVKWLLFFSAGIGIATLSAVWLYQPYFQLVGLPIAFFGIVWAVSNLVSGSFSFFAEPIENRLGKKNFFWLLPALLVVSLFLLAGFASLPFIVFAFTIQIPRGLKIPIISYYLNQELSNEKRATVLSIDGMLSRLAFAVFSPLLGLLADHSGVQSAFFALGFFSLLAGTVCLWKLHQHRVLS